VVNPFVVLGVGPDASAAEIRRAFADRVRAAHPDAGASASGAADRLAELIRARDSALGGPEVAASPVRFYRRPRGLERIVGRVRSGLPWGPRRSGRNLQ
jgi:hypothetical protein